MKTPIVTQPAAPCAALPLAGLVAASLLFCVSSNAELVSSDDFESYASGTALNGLNAGSGWSGGWTGVSGASVSNEAISLNVGGNTLGGGNSLKIAAVSDNVLGRPVVPAAEGIDVYVGFIFQIKGGTPGTPVSGNVFTGWQALDAAPSATNDSIGYLGASGKAGARVKNTSTSFDTALLYGQTYLYIIQYTDWDGTAYQTTRVWLNPTSTADEFTSNSAITRSQTVAGGGSAGFNGLRCRSVGLSASTYYLVDDLRVGTSWESVAGFPKTIAADANWVAYDHSLEITSGGVFDFSGMLDAPAGKYGAILTTTDGHFEFENRTGVRTRFAGINLAFTANFLTHAQVDTLADRLARCGYNSVRLHLFDGDLCNVSSGGNSYDLRATKLELLDYLFNALKTRGIYINIDLFSGRGFSAAELTSFGLPSTMSAGAVRDPFKGAVPVNAAAYESWRLFAQNLLTHVNPYTGMSWATDPALIGICPLNEDGVNYRYNSHANIRSQYDAAFTAAHPGQPLSGLLYTQFVYELGAASDTRIIAYLRSLGVKARITGSNYGDVQGLTFARGLYDYVDNHQYHSHPSFPGTQWQLPIDTNQTASTALRAEMPRETMATRLFGKPFTVTEFNFCKPGMHRSEMGVLVPAYASLQDWDALYGFQYASSSDEAFTTTDVSGSFALTRDPIGLLGHRVGSMVFLRGDVSPATGSIAWAVRPEEAYGNMWKRSPEDFSILGLVTRIGVLPGQPSAVSAANPSLDAVVTQLTGQTAPIYNSSSTLATRLQTAGVIPAGSVDLTAGKFISETGQIELIAPQQTVKVVTPASEMFILAPGSQLAGDKVAVTNGMTSGSVSVIALEGQDGLAPTLANARRVLVTHLTDALPTGMEFESTDRKRLEVWGTPPFLVRRGVADMTIGLPSGSWKAWAVDATGARHHEVPLISLGSDLWAMAVETVDSTSRTQLAYELVKGDYAGWSFTTAVRASLGSAGWSGWGAEGTANATTFTNTTLASSNANPRLGLLNGTGTGDGLGAVFAHTGSSSTASARNDRFVATTTVTPLSVTNAGPLTLAWDQAFTSVSTSSAKVLVKVNGAWYASAASFTVTTASSAGSMTNAVTRTLDLAGSAGLGTTQWYAVTFGDGLPITQNGSMVSSPIGTTLQGLGFLVQTGSGASRVAFVDNVRLVFGTVP